MSYKDIKVISCTPSGNYMTADVYGVNAVCSIINNSDRELTIMVKFYYMGARYEDAVFLPYSYARGAYTPYLGKSFLISMFHIALRKLRGRMEKFKETVEKGMKSCKGKNLRKFNNLYLTGSLREEENPSQGTPSSTRSTKAWVRKNRGMLKSK